MTYAITEFLVSAVIIIIAGTYLSRFADDIAEITGLGRLLVGSILLAGATSLPELSVDISAVRTGMADLAFGDLMGSCLFNLLILAILDLSTQSNGRMFSRQAARHALSGNLSVAIIAVVTLGMLAQPVLAAGQWLGVSYGLWIVLGAYVFGVRLVYLDQKASRLEAVSQGAELSTHRERHWSLPFIGFILAAAVIVFVGPYLAEAAGKIADVSGLGKTFIGTTLVAFSTSLPELVTSFAALRMGAHDLAIGNVFGSNAFNMLLLIPLDLIHRGTLLADVSKTHAVTAVAGILSTTVVVMGQLYQVERRRRLIEPDATLVMIIIFGSLWIMYRMEG